MPSFIREVLFVALLSTIMLLAVAPVTEDSANSQVTETLELPIVTTVIPSSSDFDRTHFHYKDGQTILNDTVQVTVVTNDPDWQLQVQLDNDTSMPEAAGITCRLLDGGKAVIRQGSIMNGYVQLLGTGEVGSFDLFLNVEGVWDGQVPDNLQRVVLVFTGKQPPRREKSVIIKEETPR